MFDNGFASWINEQCLLFCQYMNSVHYLSIMDKTGKGLGYVYPKRRYACVQPAQVDDLQGSTSNWKVTGHMWRGCRTVQPPGDLQQAHGMVSLATSTQTHYMKQLIPLGGWRTEHTHICIFIMHCSQWAKVSINIKWMNSGIYIYNEILFHHKRKEPVAGAYHNTDEPWKPYSVYQKLNTK